MTFWHQQALVDARLSELRRQAPHSAVTRRASDHGIALPRYHRGMGCRGELVRGARIQRRLGALLVEAGLHLMTRSERGRLKARLSL
jgi:hypothetical protein